MSDDNPKRCISRSERGSAAESGDPSQMNTGDEDMENVGRQGARSQRLRGSQSRNAGSERGMGQDDCGDC
jgi:hypothetical protein